MWNVLLVEDDPVTQKLIERAAGDSFKIIKSNSLKEAETRLDELHSLSLILIDRSLPDGDGLDLCVKIRNHPRLRDVPIIFITGKNTESDILSGFFAGADDYIVKPFSNLELKARMLARLARTAGNRMWAGDIEIHLDSHRAFLSQNEQPVQIPLTRIELKLLIALSQSMGSVLSRERLLQKVWGDECFVSDRVVDSHLSHLRKKISKSNLQLEALRSEGYRLTVNDKVSAAAA